MTNNDNDGGQKAKNGQGFCYARSGRFLRCGVDNNGDGDGVPRLSLDANGVGKKGDATTTTRTTTTRNLGVNFDHNYDVKKMFRPGVLDLVLF
jgi:hypothetical protein